MVQGLAACFAGLADPRRTSRCDHRLVDILAIAVCAVIACAESWEDIELYGQSKRAWLETFLALPNGIPSHDTFRRVFMLLDPDAFEACFAGLADPRRTSRCDHRLVDILAIAVCAVIACAESWEDIELYGQSKRAWLETFLALPNGIPSHDTFRRVFMLLDPDAFEACF